MCVAEHRGKSIRTGRPLLLSNSSSIFNHAINNNHPVKEENFQIINTSHNVYDLRIMESIEIKKGKTNLNESSPVELFVLSL